MEYEKVELLGLKDTLEHLLDFIWKMETSPPYFYGIFDRMKNNIELFLCVQAEDVEYLLEILFRKSWKYHPKMMAFSSSSLSSLHL